MKNPRQSIRMIVFCGLFVAVSIALSRFMSLSVPIGGAIVVRLGFGLLPVILSGVLFGPAAGFCCGFLADLIGAFLFPTGAYILPLSLTYGLAGALPALFVQEMSIRWESGDGRRVLRVRHGLSWAKTRTVWRLALGIGLSQILNSVLINTLVLSRVYGNAFFAMLPARLLSQAILIPCFTFMVHLLVWVYYKATHGDTPRFDYVICARQ